MLVLEGCAVVDRVGGSEGSGGVAAPIGTVLNFSALRLSIICWSRSVCHRRRRSVDYSDVRQPLAELRGPKGRH